MNTSLSAFCALATEFYSSVYDMRFFTQVSTGGNIVGRNSYVNSFLTFWYNRYIFRKLHKLYTYVVESRTCRVWQLLFVYKLLS